MEIIKVFPVNIFMPVTRFPCLTVCVICKSRPFWIFGQFRGLFKETNSKNWGFCIKKEREKKDINDRGSKILSSSNIGTKKHDQKESEFLISKSLNMNS